MASEFLLSDRFSPLSDIVKSYREGQQRAAIAEAFPGSGGDLSLAQLMQSRYLHSPEYITQSETARAKVAEQFAPKTSDFKLPGGEVVTAQKGQSGYELPTIRGMPAPDPNAPQPPPGVDVKKWRETRAAQLGNIDDKAVLEADKAVEAGTNAVSSLSKALDLNKKAISGPFAGKIGYGASLAPDYFSNVKAAGVATEELSNTVTNQALENLRATFGGNPTEGERKILLDVQGAVNQAPEVREKIYQNALEAANKRIAFNKKNADDMRGGKFLLPEGQRNPQATPQQQTQAPAPEAWRTKETIAAARANPQQTLADAKAAVATGKITAQEVIRRLQQSGIDPSPLMGRPTAPDVTGRALY